MSGAFYPKSKSRAPSARQQSGIRASRTLKLWNGRANEIVMRATREDIHAYIAAYSIVDMQRLCAEVGLRKPTDHEVRKFWTAGHWGRVMEDVTPTRGVWVTVSKEAIRGKPFRICSRADLPEELR